MKLCIGLLLALLAGCNKLRPLQGIRDIHPGQTSLHEALQILSEPNSITQLEGRPDTQVFHWEEYSLQIENKLVQAIFRLPNSTEKSFLYWRHAYRHRPSSLVQLADSEQWQFTIPQEGMAVIYDGKTDEVTKVVKYEAP